MLSLKGDKKKKIQAYTFILRTINILIYKKIPCILSYNWQKPLFFKI
jgi:hypothetical protein